MDFMTFREIADQVGVGIDTIRRTVRRLSFDVRKEKTSASKGATVHCLSTDDANQLIAFFENRDKPSADTDSSGLDRFGYFYIVQFVPEALPNRVKIACTDNLDTRLLNIKRQRRKLSILAIGSARGLGIKPPWIVTPEWPVIQS